MSVACSLSSSRCLPSLSAIAGLLLLTGCAKPIPELVAAATSYAQTPPVVTGADLEACIASVGYGPRARPATEARYSAEFTSRLSHHTYLHGAKRTAVAMRVYVLDVEATGLLGRTVRSRRLCIYELHAGALQFLDQVDEDQGDSLYYTDHDAVVDRIVAKERRSPST